MKFLQLAFSLLTILPVGRQSNPEAGDTGRAAIWFPWVGITVGFIAVVGWGIFKLLVPIFPATVLTLTLWIVLSGGLHLDGLADCCDGLFSAAKPEKRIKILADPHTGTFGILGLVLVLLMKLALLYSIEPTRMFYVMLLAPTISRWFVLPAARFPLARPDGMAADFAAGLMNNSIFIAAIIPFALTLWGGWQAAIAVLLAGILCYGIIVFAEKRIGGVTGDVFGMIIELSEVMVLLTYAAF